MNFGRVSYCIKYLSYADAVECEITDFILYGFLVFMFIIKFYTKCTCEASRERKSTPLCMTIPRSFKFIYKFGRYTTQHTHISLLSRTF